MAEHRNPNLKNKAVFTQRDMVFGIPTRVFVGVMFLVGFSVFVFCMYMPIWMGLIVSAVLALIALIPVYLVHKDDPEAYLVWLRSLITPSRLTTTRSCRRPLLLVTSGIDGTLKVTPLNSQKTH